MEELWTRVDRLTTAVSRSKAVNVNARALRDEAASISQAWFREHRPGCTSAGMSDSDLGALDAAMHQLLRLSNGPNLKSSYVRVLKQLRKDRPSLQTKLHLLEGQSRESSTTRATTLELRIVTTLDRMLPPAALSYRQVLADLSAPERFSYRGTATELREVVRETLDYLAPDQEVQSAPGFKLEKDRRAPTMKQKARFILKARGVGESSRSAPEQSVELLEDQVASLARSVYERGSASTHAATVRSQVLSFKAYADAVLAELLGLHAETGRS